MTPDVEISRRANELYWNSDVAVNEIADRLDLSKGSLYGAIDPLPAGIPCPECGQEMEYPNRTAFEKGTVTCPSCGREEEESEMGTEGPRTARYPSSEPARYTGGTVILVTLVGATAGFALGRLFSGDR